MSILVGMPWLRQLRIKKSKLWSEYIIFINKQVIAEDCLNLTMDNGAPNLVGKKSLIYNWKVLVERGKYHNGLINSKTVTLEIKRLVTNTLSYNTRGAEIGHSNKMKTII